MDFKQLSPNSLIIYFGKEINEDISQNVIKTYSSILDQSYDFILDIIPSYTSIVIIFDLFKIDFNILKSTIQNLKIKEINQSEKPLINIDVYYGEEVGFDLIDISKRTKLSIDEIIDIHSSKIYDVYAIGFLPGFAYLGSVDEKIKSLRLKTPRKSIPKGSVAIADTQTAVYPQNSPGGWNIIGKTVFECFDKSLDTLCAFDVGCKVKFNPISKQEFLNQGGEI